MICPKCKNNIKDDELICPHCQKVLKVQCPRCGTIGTSSLCEECGHMILVKCYKCQKINHTSLVKCPKCGFNTAASISLRESFIDEFASLTIEFENKNILNDIFPNKKQLAVFNKNLHLLVKNLAIKNNVRLQNVENFLILRFCKNSNFQESAENAVQFAVDVAQSITEINYKLEKALGVSLKVRMSLQKRDVNSSDVNYKSGVNIKLLYESTQIPEIIKNIQVIVDLYIYQALCKKYRFQSLTSVYVKNELIMLYELKLKRLIKIPKEPKDEKRDIDFYIKNLSEDVNFVPESVDDDSKLFKFSEVKCSFRKIKNTDLKLHLCNLLSYEKYNFVSVKSSDRYGKLNLLSKEELIEVAKGYNLYNFTCIENLKYVPYGFWQEFLLVFYNTDLYSINLADVIKEQKINLPANEYLKNLLLKKEIVEQNYEQTKLLIAEALLDLFLNLKEKALFVINDIEHIDESSLEILKYLINNDAFKKVTFLFSSDENFSIHSKIVKLIGMSNYVELELQPVANKEILTKYKNDISEISMSFAFNKVLEMTLGAEFYFRLALRYLVLDKFLFYKQNKLEILENKMLVLSLNIEDIFTKLFSLLMQQKELLDLFILILYLGYRVPVKLLKFLQIKELDKKFARLEMFNFIEFSDDYVYIKNYHLMFKILNKFIDAKQIVNILLPVQKVLLQVKYPFFLSAIIKELLALDFDLANELEKHAVISKNYGDLAAYFCCVKKYLEILNAISSNSVGFSMSEKQQEKYMEIIDLLYHYYPEKIVIYLSLLLQQAEEENDDKKIKKLANQLLQCSVINENYTYTTLYLNKILSRYKDVSLNPVDKNFDIRFLLANMVKIEIYHVLGRFGECVSDGCDILKYITPKSCAVLALEKIEKSEFTFILQETVFSVLLSALIKLSSDFKKILKSLSLVFGECPLYFDILDTLYDFVKGENIDAKFADFEKMDFSNDKYSLLSFSLLKIVKVLKNSDWLELANQAYAMKLVVQNEKIQFVYFCDLMIAYAYKQMHNFDKAEQIYQNIYQSVCDCSLIFIKYLTIYLLADLASDENDAQKTIKYIDGLILTLEGDENTSEFFLMFFKALLAKNLFVIGEQEKAKHCVNSAYVLALKLGLKEKAEEYKNLLFKNV